MLRAYLLDTKFNLHRDMIGYRERTPVSLLLGHLLLTQLLLPHLSLCVQLAHDVDVELLAVWPKNRLEEVEALPPYPWARGSSYSGIDRSDRSGGFFRHCWGAYVALRARRICLLSVRRRSRRWG